VTTPERRGRGGLLVPLGLVLLASTVAAMASEKRAEKPYALIFGTVYVPDYRSVYGVRVKIRRADQKKARWELYSDHQGEFAQRVPADTADYILWAEPQGKRAPTA